MVTDLITSAPRPAARRQHGPAGVLAFASALADFKSYLQWIDCHTGQCGCGEGSETGSLVTAISTILAALENGSDSVTAISAAIGAWQEAREAAQAAGEQRREATRTAYERQAAEEKVTRTAACPYCTAPPGEPCHSATTTRKTRSWGHRGRWRLARSLNDGEADLPGKLPPAPRR
jgi:hypothetical protein